MIASLRTVLCPRTILPSAAALVLCGALALPAGAGAPSGSQAATLTTPAARAADAAQGTASRQAQTADVNGWVWQDSDNAAKLSFLLGVENAIAMEYALSEALAASRAQPAVLSPFQQGWVAAFQGQPRQNIVNRIDAFYVAHPDQRDRHVFDVIWTDMIVPATPVKSIAAPAR